MTDRTNELLALPDDELNRAAEEAAGVQGLGISGEAFYVIHPNHDARFEHFKDGDTFNPATDHNDAARMRHACKNLGLKSEFGAALWSMIPVIGHMAFEFDLRTVETADVFAISDSTPRQITVAAIVALEQKAQQPADTITSPTPPDR